jgi:hypothetical protein
MLPPAAARLLVLIASLSALSGQQPGRTLLPTRDLARKIADVNGVKRDGPIDTRSPKVRVALMRGAISSFIIRQIQAYPSIDQEVLQKQLDEAFGDGPGPRVFALPGDQSPRIFVVTYCWIGFNGKGGSETILESYIWEKEKGVHLGASLIPASLSGFKTGQEKVCWFPEPDTYWVLVSGPAGGASGRVISGTAAVFEIGPDKVKALWTASPLIGSINAYVPPISCRWEVEYSDVKRVYGNLPHSTLLDVYQVDYAKRTFRRLVHQPLD